MTQKWLTTLWRLYRGGLTRACEAWTHRDGFEARLTLDGSLVDAQVFGASEHLQQYSETRRLLALYEGWQEEEPATAAAAGSRART